MQDDDTVATDTAPQRERLEFQTAKGAGRSKWVAALLVLLLVGWMGYGYVFPTEPEEEEVAASQPRLVSVAVRASTAQPVEQVFVAEGQASPDRDTFIRAETSGQIASVNVRKGQQLAAGDVIASIAVGERAAQLERAREDVRFAQRDLENAEQLLQRGAETGDRVSQARAALAGAEAQLVSAEKALDDTILRAPFAGRLDALEIDPGEFVSTGDEAARIVDIDPLTIVFQVPQQAMASLLPGMMADVSFITGEMRRGPISFVGASADDATRTFRAEIEVENADGAIPAGLSARVRIPTGESIAHFISPAILSLDTDGTLGVKVLGEGNVVKFHEISIIRAETSGIWISGLPDEAEIITIGQGFVSDGEEVAPRAEGEGAKEDGSEAAEVAEANQ